jgi:hypothetical protein
VPKRGKAETILDAQDVKQLLRLYLREFAIIRRGVNYTLGHISFA